ncbi:hypothetical protein A2U01_0022170, partial [Trifolium medium]|nr:hypothetical protein [Trifolium medium]
MGKGKKASKGDPEKKETSIRKDNKKTAASSKKRTKPSSSKGENSRTCRASLSSKGKKDELPPK